MFSMHWNGRPGWGSVIIIPIMAILSSLCTWAIVENIMWTQEQEEEETELRKWWAFSAF